MDREKKRNPKLLLIANLLGNIVPTLALPRNKAPEDHPYPELEDEGMRDPLCYNGGLRIRTGSEFLDGTDAVREDYTKITCPLFIMHVSGLLILGEDCPLSCAGGGA